MSEIGASSRASALRPRAIVASVQAWPEHRLLACPGALGDRRHAAVGDPDLRHPALLQLDLERAEQRRDVLIEALGELVAAELPLGARQRHADQLDELARRQRGLAIVEVEVLERQRPPHAALAQHQLGAERDQRRHEVADRRAVGDIAADRPGIADLDRAEAAEQLAEVGPARAEGGQRVAVGDRRADL